MAPTKAKSKECIVCHNLLTLNFFAKTRSLILPEGHMPICNGCIETLFKRNDEENAWRIANKLCQMADFPFVLDKWNEVYETNKEKAFAVYAQIMGAREYETIDWDSYNKKYIEAVRTGTMNQYIPELYAQHMEELKLKWGPYVEEQIVYLENLLQGIMNSQNIANDLQFDQALKLCRLSLDMDERIRAGDTDLTKTLTSYNKLIEVSGFSPKNSKNMGDFDSIGELFAYLEKLGWENKYYDGVTRDVVDATIKNVQAANRRLYLQESGIGDEINQRIEALKNIQKLENEHNFLENYTDEDIDNYENAGFVGLEDFDPEA